MPVTNTNAKARYYAGVYGAHPNCRCLPFPLPTEKQVQPLSEREMEIARAAYRRGRSENPYTSHGTRRYTTAVHEEQVEAHLKKLYPITETKSRTAVMHDGCVASFVSGGFGTVQVTYGNSPPVLIPGNILPILEPIRAAGYGELSYQNGVDAHYDVKVLNGGKIGILRYSAPKTASRRPHIVTYHLTQADLEKLADLLKNPTETVSR